MTTPPADLTTVLLGSFNEDRDDQDDRATGVQSFDPRDPEAVLDAIVDLGARVSFVEGAVKSLASRGRSSVDEANVEEAMAWIRGEWSTANTVPQDPFETWEVRVNQSDAAMVQRAYWVLKAYQEGLVPPPKSTAPPANCTARVTSDGDSSDGTPGHLVTVHFHGEVGDDRREEVREALRTCFADLWYDDSVSVELCGDDARGLRAYQEDPVTESISPAAAESVSSAVRSISPPGEYPHNWTEEEAVEEALRLLRTPESRGTRWASVLIDALVENQVCSVDRAAKLCGDADSRPVVEEASDGSADGDPWEEAARVQEADHACFDKERS